jgi:hypothetical protein
MAMQKQEGMVQKVFFYEETDKEKLLQIARELSVKEQQNITVTDLIRLGIKEVIKKAEATK